MASHPTATQLRHHVELRTLRRASGLRPSDRLALAAERDRLLDDLEQLDARALDLAHRRRRLLADLHALRDTLWPRIPRLHARRPPPHHERPLPPTAPDPIPVRGRQLRGVALGLLARGGPLSLTELHRLLHLSGYVIDAPHAVKSLADALGYETRLGRTRRVSRGVYALTAPGRRRSSRTSDHGAEVVEAGTHLDPLVASDPWAWDDEPDPHYAAPPCRRSRSRTP